MPYTGEVLADTYQIIEEIGKGGTGIIYKAYHLNLQKYVVVKKIKDHFTGVLNVRGEVDILKSLHHTCLPQVYDFIQIGSEIFTVIDYIEGHDLKYFIDSHYQFSEQTLQFWLRQLLEVLDYLHKQGILHLDIKPANIMVTPEHNVYLIDFNISFDGEGDAMTGISETYASPEQYRKWLGILYNTKDQYITLDVQSDLYSLGATFYHMMTGYPPNPDPSGMIPFESFQLNYSENLRKSIQRLLQVDKRKRVSSAEKALALIRRMERTKEEKHTLRAVFGIMLIAVSVVGTVLAFSIVRNHRVTDSGREMAMMTAENYALEGEYEQALSLYRELYEEQADETVLRQLAALSIQAEADAGVSKEQAARYLEDAIQYYERLYQEGLSEYADQLNLAIAYMKAGMDGQAEELLKAMLQDYPDEYKIYVYLSTLYYNAEMEKPAKDRDFSQIRAWIGKAAQLAGENTDDKQLQLLIDQVGT